MKTNKRILAIVPARGGSKGLKNKNIVNLNGKPLLTYTAEAALSSKYISKVILSSDSEEILEVGRKSGLVVQKRPDYLSEDQTASEDVVDYVLKSNMEEEHYDYVMLLQPTSPLRNSIDIDNSIELLLESDSAEGVISVVDLGCKPYKSFYIENGYLKGVVNDKYPFMRRQDLPVAYLPNGAIYLISTAYFYNSKRLISNHTIPYIMPAARSYDVDSNDDLLSIEKILNEEYKTAVNMESE